MSARFGIHQQRKDWEEKNFNQFKEEEKLPLHITTPHIILGKGIKKGNFLILQSQEGRKNESN